MSYFGILQLRIYAKAVDAVQLYQILEISMKDFNVYRVILTSVKLAELYFEEIEKRYWVLVVYNV